MNIEPDDAKSAYETLRNLDQQCTQINVSELPETVVELLAEAASVPTFMLKTWVEEHNVQDIIRTAAQNLGNYIKQQHNDEDQKRLLAIVSNKQDFGVVFIPTELLRHLWNLGVAVIQLQEKQPGAGDRIEEHALEILEQSAQWVQYCNKRWGKPPDAYMVPTIPNESLPF
jgi:hypothetical protein